MKLAIGVLTVVLAGTATSASGQAPCAGAFQDSVSVATLSAFARVAAVPPVWDDYTLARHPLLLLADSTFRGRPDTPVCAAIWRYDSPLEPIELSVRPPFATPLYGMIDTERLGPRSIEGASDLVVIRRAASAAVGSTLREHGITRLVMFKCSLQIQCARPAGGDAPKCPRRSRKPPGRPRRP